MTARITKMIMAQFLNDKDDDEVRGIWLYDGDKITDVWLCSELMLVNTDEWNEIKTTAVIANGNEDDDDKLRSLIAEATDGLHRVDPETIGIMIDEEADQEK